MRRVSSRQRLVSWDANDETAIGFAAFSEPISGTCSGCGGDDDENISDEYYDSYDDNDDIIVSPTSTTTTSQQQFSSFFTAMAKKKRKRRSGGRVHLIPPDPTTTTTEIELPNDLWCQIHTFLDKPDLQSVLCVNLHHRRLLLHHTTVWQSWLQRQWPHLLLQQQQQNNNNNNAALVVSTTHIRRWVTQYPWSPTGPTRLVRSSSTRGDDGELWEWTDDTTARYTGATNTGDRCLKADAPLWNTSRRMLRPVVGTSGATTLEPTLLSYFELTIREHSSSSSSTASTNNNPDENDEFCIAIGLATSSFGTMGRQPGWDSLSYGWHGDDGGLFHGAGSMRQSPLETFGPGDTVGCGIVNSSSSSSSRKGREQSRICFTKNGKFLGTPFTLKNHQYSTRRSLRTTTPPPPTTDWYPVIGIDAPHTISCNFGATPFVWDLQLPAKSKSNNR